MKSLKDCIENYIKPVKLDSQNQWLCDKCQRKSQAVKKISIWTAAEYLLISYKRYTYQSGRMVKDNTKIESPTDLDISSYVEDGKEYKYDLCAIVSHKGSLNNGHYVSSRKIKDIWKVFNDNSVLSTKNVDTSSAYYLVYQRKI